MSPTLLRCLSKKILLFSILLFGVAAQNTSAQTTLSPGDLVIVSANADDAKNFDFIPLVDLEAGTVIKFTDDAWIEASSSFRGGEGTVTYTAPNFLSAGTVVSFSGEEGNGFIKGGRFDPSASGDNILVYQGEELDPNFLYGVGWAQGDSWEYKGDSTNESDIPAELSRESNTILSLGTTDNYQYNPANGTEGTKNSLLKLIGNEDNWIENNDRAFSAFSSSFTLVDPPTIAFKTDLLTVNEADGSAAVNVTLVESNKSNVSVEAVFLPSPSTASANDISNFSTETIHFSSADTSGSTQTVTIQLSDDSEYDGKNTAVFQLQNLTAGTLISPQVLTVEIEDDDAPKVVINEILANPGETDANGDGNPSSYEDEFVEIVNNQSTDIDISGWTLADEGSGESFDYTFPEGITLPAGQALVLFDGGSPQGYFGGAVVHTIGGGLSLNNSDETLFLRNKEGNTINEVYYEGSEDGESLNRDPDGTGTVWVEHSEISGSGGNKISPGTKVDGSSFGAVFSIAIRGGEGWRMISSPVQNATFSDLLDEFWTQGPQGSDAFGEDDDATIYAWNESNGGAFSIPSSMTASPGMEPGKGYIVYFFEDDEYNSTGIQGGFPKVIHTEKPENESPVTVSISATDADGNGSVDGSEGWNLLGNPFGTDISVAAVKNAIREAVNPDSALNENIAVWNHAEGNGNGGYVILDDEDTIAPFQAFWVRFTDANGTSQSPGVSFNREELAANQGTRFYKRVNNTSFEFSLELHGEQFFDTYYLAFEEQGKVDLGRYDAFKLFSLKANSINLYSRAGNQKLQKNVLPEDLETPLEVPLFFDAGDRESLIFNWKNIEGIPRGWQVMLIDKERGKEIDLKTAASYEFNTESPASGQKGVSKEKPLLNRPKGPEGSSRFILSIEPPESAFNQEDIPESVKLNPNYPNPFSPSTTISYELAEETQVTLSIWNMIGQKVATLVDGVVEAGTHEEIWSPSNMPSGMYIARLEVAGQVFIRKMTLIK